MKPDDPTGGSEFNRQKGVSFHPAPTRAARGGPMVPRATCARRLVPRAYAEAPWKRLFEMDAMTLVGCTV